MPHARDDDERQTAADPEAGKFALLYLETGNASESYRRSYDVGKMDDRTTQKRAQELLHHPGVAARIGELQKVAAEKAGLSREWVLTRLMRNAQVSLGEQTIKQRVERKNKDGAIEVAHIETTAHDPSAANRALELLGRSGEVRLFEEAAAPTPSPAEAPPEQEGDRLADLADGLSGYAVGRPGPTTQPAAASTGSPERRKHLEEIAKRYRLRVVDGGVQAQSPPPRKVGTDRQ